MEFVWAFNMKVFIQAYKDLGYSSQLDDWNVRVSNDGEIRLDNSHTKTTTTFLIEDSILFAKVSPWNIEISDSRTQNIDLLQTNFGWRNSNLEPCRDPAAEAIAFINHLSTLGYYPLKIEGEYLDEEVIQDIPCY